MAALTSALIAIAGVVLGWVAIEIACKPCLDKGREAIDRSLDPNYDRDGDGGGDDANNTLRVPLDPSQLSPSRSNHLDSATSTHDDKTIS